MVISSGPLSDTIERNQFRAVGADQNTCQIQKEKKTYALQL